MKKQERCPWAYGASQLYIPYHDKEWGVPMRDDRKQFEFLTLESAQAGLSWLTIAKSRDDPLATRLIVKLRGELSQFADVTNEYTNNPTKNNTNNTMKNFNTK